MIERMGPRREDGASAVEYGLLAVAIAAAVVLIVFMLGGVVKDAFNGTCDTVNSQAFNHTDAGC
jgi:Flp pilus assembly pilin Flp